MHACRHSHTRRAVCAASRRRACCRWTRPSCTCARCALRGAGQRVPQRVVVTSLRPHTLRWLAAPRHAARRTRCPTPTRWPLPGGSPSSWCTRRCWSCSRPGSCRSAAHGAAEQPGVGHVDDLQQQRSHGALSSPLCAVALGCTPQAVLAHELGHLKCDHGLWLTVANVLASGTVRGGAPASQSCCVGLAAWLQQCPASAQVLSTECRSLPAWWRGALSLCWRR